MALGGKPLAFKPGRSRKETSMKTRILAAALCCLLLAACGSLSDRQRDRQYDTLQDSLTYTERAR